jgi:hypothetical protein
MPYRLGLGMHRTIFKLVDSAIGPWAFRGSPGRFENFKLDSDFFDTYPSRVLKTMAMYSISLSARHCLTYYFESSHTIEELTHVDRYQGH